MEELSNLIERYNMNQETFVNTYIEILSATVTEAIQKNLVIQAQKKIAEQSLEETKKFLEREQTLIAKLRQEFDDVTKQRDINANEANEYKKNVEHIETFKNELIKCRKYNSELLSEIETLKTKIESFEKKNEEIKEKVSKAPKIKTKPATIETIIQDSGKF